MAIELDKNCAESHGTGLTGVLGQRDDHQHSKRPDAQEHHLDDDGGEVRQGRPLAVSLQDWEEEHRLRDVDCGVQQHQKGPERQE